MSQVGQKTEKGSAGQQTSQEYSDVEIRFREPEDLFSILGSDYSMEDLDLRENPDGFVLAQDPEGTTAEVATKNDSIVAREVEPRDVEFEEQEGVEDVFGRSVVAE